MGAAFVTLAELEVFTGARYTDDDLVRAEAILPLVSDLIRVEGRKCGIDVDERIGIYLEPDAIHIMKKSEYSGMFGDYSSFSNEFDELSDAEAAAEAEEEE